MPHPSLERDPGLQKAIDAAGGRSALARRLGIPRQNLKWTTCPQDWVLPVAEASGVPAEEIRPDLVDWIRVERSRRLLERARSRFGAQYIAPNAKAKVDGLALPAPQTVEIFDLGVLTAAMKFAAREAGLTPNAVWGADHLGQKEKSARAYALALAVVAGRVSSTLIASVVGCTRQNVDNAARRYERARDGDVDEDEVADGVVIVERGRRSKVRAPDDALWEAERRFLEQLGAM